MNRNRRGAKPQRKVLRVWTYPEAQAAMPYISSIVRSLREHWLDMQSHRQAVRRLEQQPGRPDRVAIIAQEEGRRAMQQASDRFDHALEELQALDIYCLDPTRGEALIPFVHGEQLAWYVYDLFDNQTLGFWRYHSDPFEARRPIAEALEGNTRVTWTA